jgi:metal-responsive CopG/Arc/MetJ family transcriptional regulator
MEKCVMRATVMIEKDILDELLKEKKAKSKATAVKKAIHEYLKREKIEKIKSMKGKLGFDLTAQQIRHCKR